MGASADCQRNRREGPSAAPRGASHGGEVTSPSLPLSELAWDGAGPAPRRGPHGCASGGFARERGETQSTSGHPVVAGIACGHWGQTNRTVVS